MLTLDDGISDEVIEEGISRNDGKFSTEKI